MIFFFDNIQVTNVVATVAKEAIPDFLAGENLIGFFPNPVHHSATIHYYVPVTGHVDICIYNLSGQKLTTLVNEVKPVGKYSVT